jgi:Domain of unknown function (DUF4111)/Nucleotidyltransferase domain
LVGVYLYGSMATGDFEPAVSDIDLIAVLTGVPDDVLVARLHAMHAGLARADPGWDDRIEVDYVAAEGLARCRTDTTVIARISPDEPLHMIEAGRDFLLDWYPARLDGIALLGPPIDTLIPPIPEEDYVVEVRKYLASFRDRFDDDASSESQAYAILTMCRGLYTIRSGERLSKKEAASRARTEFPRWTEVIERALGSRDRRWSQDERDGSGTVVETLAFIADMDELIERSWRPGPRA